METEIVLAYESGTLRQPELTRIQKWALTYYIYSQKRERNSRREQTTMEFMAFVNPTYYAALTEQLEQEKQESSDMTVAPDFNEFEEILRQMESGATLTFKEEWADEEGWV